MNSNKLFSIVFVCIAILFPVKESNALGKSKHHQQDEGPCDTCPRRGKCVPKVSCPAHVRPGSYHPECHLEGGQIGICCYTGSAHAAKSDKKSESRSSKSKNLKDVKRRAYNASKAKLKIWSERSRSCLNYSDDTIVRAWTPDYGHHLPYAGTDKKAKKLAEGALLNLFAVEDLRQRQAIDDEDIALGYDVVYDGAYCPPQPICPDEPSMYRSISGECTNPDHPTWGAANTGYERLLPPDYSDGIWSFRTSKSGAPLPSARAVSAAMLPDGDYPSSSRNIMNMQIGQFVAHDLTGAVITSYGNGSGISCCTKDGGWLPPEQLHYACAPIDVDPADEFFSYFGRTCLNFVRVQLAPDCSCGYAKQMNGATHFLDLSQLYGKTEEKQKSLRAPGGFLKVFKDYGRDLPPLTDRSECMNTKAEACYDSGDNHGNQQITLTVLHTMFTREHNRIVRELTRLNPGCDDETYFQSARRILIAIYQHIVMDEWLPLLIGPKLMKLFHLDSRDGYSTSYDSEVNPSMTTEFVAGAMRSGHSTVDGKLNIVSPRTKELMEVISFPEVMLEPSRMRMRTFLDRALAGMLAQPMQAVDPMVTIGLTRYLFRNGHPFGLDLASLNVQRGRDMGVRSYNDYRVLCGLRPIEDFDYFLPNTRDRLASVYECIDDIDLWVGGLLEEPVKGGTVGITFAFIIAEQFSRLMKGDRYYYNYGPKVNPGAFTPSQLVEIKKMTLASLLCKNLDRIELTSMPPNAFLRSDLPGNTPVECEDDNIPSIDFSCFQN